MITRKQFLKLAAMSAGAVALFSSVGFLASQPRQNARVMVCIRPVVGQNYSPSFLRFCERSQFASVPEAIRHVQDRRVAYRLVARPA